MLSLELIGYHNSTTSEVYSEDIRLPPDNVVQPGESLRMSLTKLGKNGTTFQLVGFAVCD